LETNSSTPLAYPLVVKPATSIKTLGEAAKFIATLSPDERAEPHWHRAISSLGTAIREPRYATLATINIETALTMDHLIASNSPSDGD
jgi:hypothetical protein